MVPYLTCWCGLKLDRRAVTALEYAVIGGIIVVMVAAGFNEFALQESDKFSNIAAGI